LSTICLEYDTEDSNYFINATGEVVSVAMMVAMLLVIDAGIMTACKDTEKSQVFSATKQHGYLCKYGQSVKINNNVTASFSSMDLYPLGDKQDKRE